MSMAVSRRCHRSNYTNRAGCIRTGCSKSKTKDLVDRYTLAEYRCSCCSSYTAVYTNSCSTSKVGCRYRAEYKCIESEDRCIGSSGRYTRCSNK